VLNPATLPLRASAHASEGAGGQGFGNVKDVRYNPGSGLMMITTVALQQTRDLVMGRRVIR
jgi:hypothetical protein